MNLFAVMREEKGVSFRTISEGLDIEISHVRVMDLFKHLHGAPTLSEVIALSKFFEVSPSKIIKKAQEKAAENPGISELSEEERIAITKKKVEQGGFGLMAHHDPNKELEMEGGDGR